VKTKAILFASLASALAACWQLRQQSQLPSLARSDESVSLEALLKTPPAELESFDVAHLNMACSVGLIGSEGLDIRSSLTVLAQWSERVRLETDRCWRLYHSKPGDFQNSPEIYRMTILGAVLQQDFGVGYNLQRVTAAGVFESNSVFFADSRDVFLHGLLAGSRQGTCSSLPVLYLAVGRRLGYPLKLVPTKGHLFVRWEDAGKRFNVECTSRGVCIYDDGHYRQWPVPLEADEEESGYLKSLTAVETLAVFMNLRGHCLLASGRIDEGLKAHLTAAQLAPESQICRQVLAEAQTEQRQKTERVRWSKALPPPASPARRSVDPNPLNQVQNP